MIDDATKSRPRPRATYRLQFHKEFGFADATAIVPYLASLGVSHVYASSFLKARPGSTHGYDITDHAALNPELGTEDDFATFNETLRGCGIGLILDFVPNHMGVGGSDNPYWLDVLEWGPHSEHAGWFDIDWDPDRRYLHEKLLVPFLGDQYGIELEAGSLALRFDADAGTLAVWAYDTHKLPICPGCYPRVLGHANLALERIGDGFADLPSWRPQVAARASTLKRDLATLAASDADARGALADAVAALNADKRALDALIGEQYWRVASFHVAGDDINYRRFFNINDLAGIRMELPVVFETAHRRVFAMLADGTLDGIRLDHIDGLLDPKEYLDRLRAHAPRPFYLVVEKILARHETLRDDWPVDGTTGYDFTNFVLGALVDPAGEDGFTRAYHAFTGETAPFRSVVHACKLRIMDNEMASELNVLGRDAGRVARQNPRTADFTRNLLQRAIRQIIACFPVYRTYLDHEGVASDEDRRDLGWAITTARRQEPEIPPSVFDFLEHILTGDLVGRPESGFARHAVLRVAMKLQQYSGPVMAKGLEDTAFYRWNRFVALNEVGGEPEVFGLTLANFHRNNVQRARRMPASMLGTSTHDTKRGEDVRARLAVLSSMPDEWLRQVGNWSRLIRARRGDVEGTAPPDRNDEYLLYQLLVGSWPVALLEPDALDTEEGREGLADYAGRIRGTLEKSVREAKRHSNWSSPDEAYENALQGFAADALDASRPAFLQSFLPFARRIAELGVDNSLVQLALKLTLPGVPDFYQGSELWDLSLVDPDNRRPVDYDERRRLLAAERPRLGGDGRGEAMTAAYASWQDGTIKLATTHLLLALRAAHPALFADASYEPLAVENDPDERVLAYERVAGTRRLAVVARRFPGAAAAMPDASVMLGAGLWEDTLTGRRHQGGRLGTGLLLASLPVAVLVSDA